MTINSKHLIFICTPFLMVLLTACPFSGKQGCGDPNALNYNPDASIEDNGVCVYQLPEPTILFDLPDNDSQYQIGDTLLIDFQVNHEREINNMRLDLIDYLTGDILYDTVIQVEATDFSFQSHTINYTHQYRELEFKLSINDAEHHQFNHSFGKFTFLP